MVQSLVEARTLEFGTLLSLSSFRVPCHSFNAVLRDPYLFINDDASRTFFGLTVDEGAPEVRDS